MDIKSGELWQNSPSSRASVTEPVGMGCGVLRHLQGHRLHQRPARHLSNCVVKLIPKPGIGCSCHQSFLRRKLVNTRGVSHVVPRLGEALQRMALASSLPYRRSRARQGLRKTPCQPPICRECGREIPLPMRRQAPVLDRWRTLPACTTSGRARPHDLGRRYHQSHSDPGRGANREAVRRDFPQRRRLSRPQQPMLARGSALYLSCAGDADRATARSDRNALHFRSSGSAHLFESCASPARDAVLVRRFRIGYLGAIPFVVDDHRD